MKALSVEKGLLRETESVQEQIQALVKCDVREIPCVESPLAEKSLATHRWAGKRDYIDSISPASDGFISTISCAERGYYQRAG